VLRYGASRRFKHSGWYSRVRNVSGAGCETCGEMGSSGNPDGSQCVCWWSVNMKGNSRGKHKGFICFYDCFIVKLMLLAIVYSVNSIVIAPFQAVFPTINSIFLPWSRLYCISSLGHPIGNNQKYDWYLNYRRTIDIMTKKRVPRGKRRAWTVPMTIDHLTKIKNGKHIWTAFRSSHLKSYQKCDP
jgi:hypothetical protein